jgi:hypothetical protein
MGMGSASLPLAARNARNREIIANEIEKQRISNNSKL